MNLDIRYVATPHASRSKRRSLLKYWRENEYRVEEERQEVPVRVWIKGDKVTVAPATFHIWMRLVCDISLGRVDHTVEASQYTQGQPCLTTSRAASTASRGFIMIRPVPCI
jgi:hypothetical protein